MAEKIASEDGGDESDLDPTGPDDDDPERVKPVEPTPS